VSDSRLIDTRVIGFAFHNAIKVLGERNVNALIEDLKHYGVYFGDPEFDLLRLSNAIIDILGENAASLIFERFALELNRLYGMSSIRAIN
jgi:hypothetical protein